MWYRTAAPWRGRRWSSTGARRRRLVACGLRRSRLCSRHHRTTRSAARGKRRSGLDTVARGDQNDSRKRFYNDGIKVLAEEENSPFVRAVILAESTSLVTNLGTHGIGYINGDLTAALSRLPVDDWIGIQADSHWASDGISVGTATLFDHQGAFGMGLVTAVANPAAQIDFWAMPFAEGTQLRIEVTTGPVSAPTSTMKALAAVPGIGRVGFGWLPRLWRHADRRASHRRARHPDVRLLGRR